jgi:plasmid stability protein
VLAALLNDDPWRAILDSSFTIGVCFYNGSNSDFERSAMATLTIKNVPEKLHKRLKESAALHRRSMNSEAICCLETVLGVHRVDPKEFLAKVDARRKRMPYVNLTEEFLRAAKNEDRPWSLLTRRSA